MINRFVLERRTNRPVLNDQEIPNSVEIVDINNEDAIYDTKHIDKIKDNKEQKKGQKNWLKK